MRFIKKLLKLSWKINNLEYEFIAYDLLGISYYYIGDLKLASYFHYRAVNDKNEDK